MSSVKIQSQILHFYFSRYHFTDRDNYGEFYTTVSDEGNHDKHSKKELLGGKRKDKKDRKDRGYATLEGESSPDEDQETK